MNFENIPDVMKQYPHWVVWRLEDRGGKKPSKTPYSVHGGHGKVNDPSTWATYQEAVKDFQGGGYSGIGFVFTNTTLVGVDIDHCFNPETGEIEPAAAEVLQTLNSYTELSQSGTGFHIIMEGKLPKGDRKNEPFEMYGDGSPRYFAMTGNLWGERREIRADQSAIDEVHLKYINKRQEKPTQREITSAPAFVAADDNDLLRLARGAKNGDLFRALFDSGQWEGRYPSQSEADMALCNMLAFWTGRDAARMDSLFRMSGLMRDKWDRKQSGTTYGAITIAEAVRRCDKVYEGRKTAAEDFAGVSAPAPPSEWEPPIPFDTVNVPPFPVECLPDDVKNFALALSETAQTSVDMPAVTALAVLAMCVQGKIIINPKPGWIEPLNLYAVVVAPPAERKSAVVMEATRPIYDYEREMNEMLAPEIAKNTSQRNILQRSIEELEKRAAKGNADITEIEEKQRELAELPIMRPLRLIADDATPEALVSLMADQGGRMATISTEGGLFEIVGGRYSGSQTVNIDALLKAHSGDAIRVDRKGRPSEYIDHPVLSILLAIQPVVLDGLMGNGTFRGRGLPARFLYSIPKSRVGGRRYEAGAMPEGCANRFHNLVYALLGIPKGEKPGVIRLTPEAHEISKGFADELEPRLIGDLEDLADWAGKWHGAVMRIAGIIHCCKFLAEAERHSLDKDTMLCAIAIGHYFLEHAKAAFLKMCSIEINDAKYIIQRLKGEKPTSVISQRDLLRLCQKFKCNDELSPGLTILLEYGYLKEIEKEATGKRGRPTIQYLINPEIYQ